MLSLTNKKIVFSKQKLYQFLEAAHILQRRKIVLNIGDVGVIIFVIDRHKVHARSFVKYTDNMISKIQPIFDKYKNASVCIFLDNVDQQFKLCDMPLINFVNLYQLLHHRLNKELARYDLKKAIYSRKYAKDRIEYMFVGAKITADAQHWFHYIDASPNHIASVSVFPLEYSSLNVSLEKNEEVPDDKEKWKIIVTKNKTIGFRQVVLRNNKVVLTRVMSESSGGLVDVMAGAIHQELVNTTLYLSRLKYDSENHYLGVYIIVPQEIKSTLLSTTLKLSNVKIFTPYEIAEILQVAHIAQPENKFIDVILSYHATQCGSVAKFSLPHMKFIDSLYHLSKVLSFACVLILLCSLGYVVNNAPTILLEKRSHIKFVRELKDIRGTLNEFEKLTKIKDYDYHKIVSIKNIYSKLFEYSNVGNQIHETLRILKSINQLLFIEHFYWRIEKEAAALNVRSTLINESKKYSDLLTSYEFLKNKLNNVFVGYNIVMSDLPSNITSDSELSEFSLNIQVYK